MKKGKITEIVIATILIISLASSYKYYIADKKNKSTDASNEVTSSSEYKDVLVELEDEAYIKTQIKEFNEPLILYGSNNNLDMKQHTTDHFQFEFNNFRVMDKLPIELLKEKSLSFNSAYNSDGSLKKENTCIAKVDFKITNMSSGMAVIPITGLRCFHVNNQGEDIKSGTNEGSIFFDSNKGKDGDTSRWTVKLNDGEAYSDTVYFIIDKVTEESNKLMIKVDPFGYADRYDKITRKYIKNNANGFIKVNLTDIIRE